jgi:hypothetical protein
VADDKILLIQSMMTEIHTTERPRQTSALGRMVPHSALAMRKRLVIALGVGKHLSTRAKVLISVAIFAISFSIRSIHAVDIQPLMYSPDEPARGMSEQYDREAQLIDGGRGILVFSDWDPSDTTLLVHAPGYSMLLAVVYRFSDRSYFYAQVVQNALNSVSPIIIFLLAGELVSWRVGGVAGMMAAVSHHLAYYSNLILPDSLCALPILVSIYILVRARHRRTTFALYLLAGLMIGLSIWLRPNALILGPFIALMMVVIASRRRLELRRAWLLAVIPILVITPITIRNYLLFHQFVPISANSGIVMLEGIANASDGRFGPLPGDDKQVGQMESVWYNNPGYRDWAEPDGIQRDRDRVKRSTAIIVRHPIWFLGSMLGRMKDMVSYVADADLVLRSPRMAVAVDPEALSAGAKGRKHPNSKQEPSPQVQHHSSDISLTFGRKLNWERAIVRPLQRITKETDEIFLFLGLPVLLFLSARRASFLLIVPLYYLLIQSTLHTEFRYTLPIHYFLFVFAAAIWVLIGLGVKTVLTKAFHRLRGLDRKAA